jgi:WhiB family redox-sensing transcriptional regulator
VVDEGATDVTVTAVATAPYPEYDDQALCRQTDPELFFPEKGGPTREAKALCAQCDFQRPCAAYALTHDVAGVWGGTSYKDRQQLRKQFGITLAPSTGIHVWAGTPYTLRDTDPDEQEEQP